MRRSAASYLQSRRPRSHQQVYERIHGSDFRSSVYLQLLLYFGIWFQVLFAGILVVAGWVKGRWMKGSANIGLFYTNFALCFLVEPLRLYVGYAGSLGARVPELFFFCVLTFGSLIWWISEYVVYSIVYVLRPPHCVLTPGQHCIFPVERACWILAAVFLFLQFVVATITLKRVVQEQSSRFFVSLEMASRSAAAAPEDDASPGHVLRAQLLETSGPSNEPGAQVLGRPQYTAVQMAVRRSHQD